jgi:hypothetical protein
LLTLSGFDVTPFWLLQSQSQSNLSRIVRENSFFLRKIDEEHLAIQISRLSDNLVLGLLSHGLLEILVSVSYIALLAPFESVAD